MKSIRKYGALAILLAIFTVTASNVYSESKADPDIGQEIIAGNGSEGYEPPEETSFWDWLFS